MLREVYLLAAISLKRARDKHFKKQKAPKFLILVLDFYRTTRSKLRIDNTPDFCIFKVINYREYDLQDPTDYIRHASLADI